MNHYRLKAPTWNRRRTLMQMRDKWKLFHKRLHELRTSPGSQAVIRARRRAGKR